MTHSTAQIAESPWTMAMNLQSVHTLQTSFSRLTRFTEAVVSSVANQITSDSVAEESRGMRPGNLSFHVFRGPGYFSPHFPAEFTSG
ncbi:MAG: hypothetical protein ACI8P0_003652 [Planctomycetaceae bacterium]|jgi:hypothetical protein